MEHVFPFQQEMKKRTGEDERMKWQAAGRKRELLRYLSPGTLKKKIPTNFKKCITHTRSLKTRLSPSTDIKTSTLPESHSVYSYAHFLKAPKLYLAAFNGLFASFPWIIGRAVIL